MSDSPKTTELPKIADKAEALLVKLLLHNKLMTKAQLSRFLRSRKDETLLPEDIVNRHFVSKAHMDKVRKAVEAKGLNFHPFLGDLKS